MNDLPQILRSNASWLKERGTFPKAAQACIDGANEIERLREALKLSLLRMRGVAIEHKTHGRPDLADVAQRWAEDIETAVTQ